MQEIVKQYGGALLVGAAGCLIFLMLFVLWPDDGSVMHTIGKQAEGPMASRTVDWDSHSDGDALNSHADRDRPTAKTKKHAIEQATIAVSDLFLLKDCDGREWRSSDKKWAAGSDIRSGAVDILSVKTSEGEEIKDNTYHGKLVWDRDTQKLTFPEPDILLIQIRVMDYDNVAATYDIPVAVDMAYPE